MNLSQYKKLAQELVTEINYYERNKDYFKGIDNELNEEKNRAMLSKIAGIITAMTYASTHDAISIEPKHISEIMDEMPELHPLEVSSDGVLRDVKIKYDLKERLMNDNSIIGNAIKSGINEDYASTEKMIRDQVKDNKQLMTEILGEKLVNVFS